MSRLVLGVRDRPGWVAGGSVFIMHMMHMYSNSASSASNIDVGRHAGMPYLLVVVVGSTAHIPGELVNCSMFSPR